MPGVFLSLPCLLLLSLLEPSSGIEGDGTVVLTTSGPIRGKRLLAGSNTVTAFLGIPYAEPPVGDLRFQKPLPHKPWSHVLEATSFRNACLQLPLTDYPDAEMFSVKTPQSENCLFLNVWVPHPRPTGPTPILVWIHGGGFYMGATSVELHSGRFLATTGNVVVASMNYRLGPLGFLSLPPDAPGNAGLWDQRLALSWLWKNAAAFGGDPAHLMLFGQSAGAAAVGLHLLSPKSRPFFTSATLQSGAPNAPWAWISLEVANKKGQMLGQLLGCNDSKNNTALVCCLQQKDPRELIKYEFSVSQKADQMGMPFVPTPDGDFLSDAPPRLLVAMHGRPIPILTGITANEGSYLLSSVGTSFNLENASSIGWKELLQAVKMIAPGAPEEAVQAVARQYSQEGKRQGEAKYRWAMDQIIGDYFIVCPVAEMARRMAEAGSLVYTYYFTHRSSSLSSPEWMGVPHSSDLLFMLGTLVSVGGDNNTHTEAEVGLSRSVMRYWTEFARNGNPMGVQNSKEQWPPFDPKKQNFFRIGMEPHQIQHPSPARQCTFLASLLGQQQKTPGEHQCDEWKVALEGNVPMSPRPI